MTEEVKTENITKKKVGGVGPMLAFIYAVLILIMAMGSLQSFLILGFRMQSSEAGMISFFLAAFLAGVGFRGVKALFNQRN